MEKGVNCHGSMWAGKWCKDCPLFGRKCDEMEGEIMSEELKLCPFCGGEAVIMLWLDGECFCVGCINDECHGEIQTDGGFGYEGKERAIKAWNKRVEG